VGRWRGFSLRDRFEINPEFNAFLDKSAVGLPVMASIPSRRRHGQPAGAQGPALWSVTHSRGVPAPPNSYLNDRVREMAEELAYKEYRIVPMPRGWGWQALIYAPGSNRHLPESPSTRDPVGRTSVLDTARLVVDRLLQSS